MTVVSIILALMVLGLFFHLPSAKEKEEEDKGEKKEKEEEEDEGKGDSETSSLSGQTSREGTSLISQFEIEPDSSTEKSSPSVFSICYALQKAKRYVLFVASELVKEEIVLILFILAVTMFNQTCIEVCARTHKHTHIHTHMQITSAAWLGLICSHTIFS